ncbi:hypothetical protein LOCC1_G000598 [Lachnellula occidentalis]|uniref:DUF7730 domain-containing protein n=1 Tax=Lachnellula occidentalis TaxID=215460 RepID=A0A8H8UKM4_9HELO|nr:hypothetical protein LOCC1_G000598 [Lachnellula occidentalis]
MESSDYRQKVEEHLEEDQRWNIVDQFDEILRDYETNPRHFQEVQAQVSRLFNHDPELLSGFQEFLLDTYPAQNAQVLAAQAERDEAHRKACERQSNSPLLTLPREIRDKIWDEVILGNVVHISPRRAGWLRRNSGKFCFHACRAEKGAGSSACPPGVGDHANCSTTGPSNYVDIRLACKQLLLELPDSETTFFSQTAFQFADLETADAFLFGLSEPQRSSITHLKLAVPYNLAGDKDYKLWTGIINYFSNPWERKSLHMDPKPEDEPAMLREPIYFYYSGCYYENNKNRMYKRYQVGRGGWSWDVGISDLKYKGEPKLDLAMKVLTDDQLEDISTWSTDMDSVAYWCEPLLQFRQYDGLTFQLYHNEGPTSTPEFEDFVAALKDRMVEPVIGPRKCMFFAGVEDVEE